MNEHLRHIPDGVGGTEDDAVPFKTRVRSVVVGSDVKYGNESGEIWWPFVIHSDGFGAKKITHLLSGYALGSHRGLSVEHARECVLALRALSLDWNWTTPTGEKWDAIASGSRTTLEAFGVISPKAQAI